MIKIVWLFVIIAFASELSAQIKPAVKTQTTRASAAKMPAAVPAKPGVDKGTLNGQTYTNRSLRFEVSFPEGWLIPGEDFESELKKAGFDLSLKAPPSVGPASRAKLQQALRQVSVVLTAYRPAPGSSDNAIVRISLEDLSPHPQIKDAVDYFDAMRGQFRTMKLPSDFKYSETQAEQLGSHQFAFLDASSNAGKKRLYATVRKGYAILFSLSYTKDEDLAVLREVLRNGNFALR